MSARPRFFSLRYPKGEVVKILNGKEEIHSSVFERRRGPSSKPSARTSGSNDSTLKTKDNQSPQTCEAVSQAAPTKQVSGDSKSKVPDVASLEAILFSIAKPGKTELQLFQKVADVKEAFATVLLRAEEAERREKAVTELLEMRESKVKQLVQLVKVDQQKKELNRKMRATLEKRVRENDLANEKMRCILSSLLNEKAKQLQEERDNLEVFLIKQKRMDTDKVILEEQMNSLAKLFDQMKGEQDTGVIDHCTNEVTMENQKEKHLSGLQ